MAFLRSLVSGRFVDFVELSDSSGTTNTSLDLTKASVAGGPGPQTDSANGRYVFDVNDGAVVEQFCFAGQGADNATFSFAVWGWEKIGDIWVASALAKVDGVLSAAVGLSGADPDNTWRFPDTLTAVYGYTPNSKSESFGGSGTDTNAMWRLDVANFKKIEVELATGGSSTALRVWHRPE